MDAQFLRFVVAIWPNCTAALTRHSDEDTITRTIVDRIGRLGAARRYLQLVYHYEPFAYTASGAVVSKGQIDIAVLVTTSREIYLAYECKKLNVTGADGARRSQAGAYVGEEGMMRFVTEKYAEGLPVGCMLGYVMDGNLSFAYARIEAAIMAEKQSLGLQGPLEAESPIPPAQRFVTKHARDGKWIEMHHALLPFMDSMP